MPNPNRPKTTSIASPKSAPRSSAVLGLRIARRPNFAWKTCQEENVDPGCFFARQLDLSPVASGSLGPSIRRISIHPREQAGHLTPRSNRAQVESCANAVLPTSSQLDPDPVAIDAVLPTSSQLDPDPVAIDAVLLTSRPTGSRSSCNWCGTA